MRLDVETITERAKLADIRRVLKSVRVPEYLFDAEPNNLEEFPPLRRPLQKNNRDWWDRSKDEPDTAEADFFINWPKYAVYYAIAYLHRPYLIASLGVGFGYTLMCLAKGAKDGGIPDTTVNGYDDETGRPGSLEWARQAFMVDRVPYNLSHSNARQYDASGIPLSHIDLFYLSDDANDRDAAKDIQLAIKTLSPRGILVVDTASGTEEAIRSAVAAGFGRFPLPDGEITVLYNHDLGPI